jgi:hypothetical protein
MIYNFITWECFYILQHVFLNRKLKVANWIGIAVVIVGLVLAGCSSVFKNQDHKTNGGKATTGTYFNSFSFSE